MIKNELIDFINKSPTAFNAIYNIKEMLIKKGFLELKEEDKFILEKDKGYFITRNESCLIAFSIGKNIQEDFSFKIVASHVDSPSFKVKPNYNSKTDVYNKINIEPYGGMINSTWLDRPLSLAGRVIVKEDNKLVSKIINIDKPILMIPNMCIHFNREINKGYSYNYAVDMQPFMGQDDVGNTILELLKDYLKVDERDILNFDLFTYNFEKGYLWGKNEEFISSSRLDDLECAFISVKSLLEGSNENSINVCALFDNEEVGSTTIQGANSDFLETVLKRINYALHFNEEIFYQSISKSFLISSDNAHAVHPNLVNYTDSNNKVYMNKGIVIKFNASQSYTTDGFSSSFIQNLCLLENIPYQFFTNKADIRGGSTLGNISNTHLSLKSVDIGLAQLAMHSSFETAGAEDINYLFKLLKAFYQ